MNKLKKIVLLGVGMVLFHGVSFAETIYLKTGKKIRGQIVERDAKQIKIDISGVKITYYMDEIDHIDEAGNQSTVTAKSALPVEAPRSVNGQTAPVNATSNPAPSSTQVSIPSTTSAKAPVPSATSAQAPVLSTTSADGKKALILDLIEASGTKETMSQMFRQIITQAPADQAASLKSVLDINEIISRLVPVYDKYFTNDELKELIAFYKGTTGRKLIKVMPSIMEDSMNATEAYFQEKMPAPNQNSSGPAPKRDSAGPAADNQKK